MSENTGNQAKPQLPSSASKASSQAGAPPAEPLETMDSETWHATMKGILDNLDHKGDFCFGQRVDVPPFHPKLTIDGITDESGECERLSFPLPASQAHRIVSVAEKAPFGKGSETILDEEVRKAWQVDASKVHFADSDAWNESLTGLVRDVCDTLGLPNSCQVQANLYKMLLYEKGGHFQRHCDTEKEPGMFGTLVIQLPAKHSGGAFVIQHGNETRTMDFAAQSEDACFATAFYADCEHEILPVTSGWRLCLVYNLVMVQQTKREASDSLPSAHALTAQSRQLRTLVEQWPTCASASDLVKGYLLEHKYTKTNLHFANLKGRDKQVCDLLREACDANGKPLFVVCLLLLEKIERGSPESYGGYYGRRRRGYYDSDDDEDYGGHHTMSEVHDIETNTDHWVGPDDQVIPSFRIAFDTATNLLGHEEDETQDFFGHSPDKEEYEGYQGNYGPTLEYWYYRSAVVFWPASKYAEVAAKGGLSFLVSYLRSVPKSEALQVGTKAVEVLEEGKRNVDTEKLLDGLLRTGDTPLMLRALHNTCSMSSENLAKTLTDVVVTMESPQVIAAVRQIVHKDGADGSFSQPCQFVQELEERGKPEVAQAVRESLVHGFLSNAKQWFASSGNPTLIVATAYRCLSLFPSFVDATIAHASPSRAGSVLESILKLQGTASNPHVQKLYKSRMAYLKKATSGGAPSFSWRQPKARFVGTHADDVNTFLHGDQQSHTFHGFNGISHARNWARKYFGYASPGRGYSATAVEGGRGQDAYVTVTKTQSLHQAVNRQHDANVAEMDRLTAVFGEATTPSKRTAPASQSSSGASPKRAKGSDEKKSPAPDFVDLTDD